MTQKYEEVFSEIRSKIKTLNDGKELFYEKNHARIKVDTDDDLLLNKPLKFQTLTIIIRCFSRGWKIVFTDLFRWVFVWIIKKC